MESSVISSENQESSSHTTRAITHRVRDIRSRTSLFVSGQLLHKCNKCLTLHLTRSAMGIKAPEEVCSTQLKAAMLFNVVWRGTLRMQLHLWGRTPWDSQSVSRSGFWRHHQPFIKLDQHRCCCSQPLQSIKAICPQHSQAPRDFTVSCCLALPQTHLEKQFNLSSYPAKWNTAFLSWSVSEPSVILNSQLLGG